jgi:hypothetical protein
VVVLKQVFANKYSCVAESKTLVINSCSVEKVHLQVVKFVLIYSCAFNHPRTKPRSKPYKSCRLRQTVSEFGEHIFPQMTKYPIQRLRAKRKIQRHIQMCKMHPYNVKAHYGE